MKEKGKKISKKEIYTFMKPYFSSPESKRVFWIAMTAMVASKLLAVASPYFLKVAVNALAGQTINMQMAYYGIAGFGLARAFSSILNESRNNLMALYLRDGIKILSE